MNNFTSYILGGLCVLLLAGTGCARRISSITEDTNRENNFSDSSEVSASLSVNSQEIVNESVYIDAIEISIDAWIVIHREDNGVPGKILGQYKVKAGNYENLRIVFDQTRTTEQELKEVKNLVAILHYDNGTLDIFEPETTDTYIELAPGMIMKSSFSIKESAINEEDR